VTNSHIYWVDYQAGSGKIRRANLDGTGVQDLVTGLNQALQVTLDLTNSHIYWNEHVSGKIRRANLDGTGVQDLITGLNTPLSIALKLVAQASSSSGEIRYVPFKSKYVLMALMAVLGGWLVLRQS